jgi:hypothetical protein
MRHLERREVLQTGLFAGASAVGAGMPRSGSANPAWEPWRDLVNFLPNQAQLEAQRRSRGRPPLEWEVQRIENASKPTLNLDRYDVAITRLPTSGPAAGSVQQLYTHVRRNISSFLDPSIAVLRAHLATDQEEWNLAQPPTGCMMVFGIKLLGAEAERGAVVVSQSSGLRWRFSPVRIGRLVLGTHPVAGNREFALEPAGSGTHIFSVRAADRAYDATPTETVVLDGAKDCWRAFQTRLVAFIRTHGGLAEARPPLVLAPAWQDAVQHRLFTRT